MEASTVVETAEDGLKFRTLDEPEKWPIVSGVAPFSNLKADVPEFVPGQPFTYMDHDTGTGT